MAAVVLPDSSLPSRSGTALRTLVLLTVASSLAVAAWQLIDIDAVLARQLRTERDAWVFALALGPAFFAIKAIAGVWGVLTGMLTTLLTVRLAAGRLAVGPRWALAGTVCAVVFIGMPMLLNRAEHRRMTGRYAAADTARPSTVGRAVELRSATAFESYWQRPPQCRDQCLDLLTFGRARSVTLSYLGDRHGPLAWTYTLGEQSADCAGPTFEHVCARLASTTLPADRLVVTATTVPIAAEDAGDVYARRLLIRDTRTAHGASAQMTQYVNRAYPGFLTIRLHRGRWSLARGGLPVLAERKLDAQRYRRLIDNQMFEGGLYPFR